MLTVLITANSVHLGGGGKGPEEWGSALKVSDFMLCSSRQKLTTSLNSVVCWRTLAVKKMLLMIEKLTFLLCI